jgi:hypothetical protein
LQELFPKPSFRLERINQFIGRTLCSPVDI